MHSRSAAPLFDSSGLPCDGITAAPSQDKRLHLAGVFFPSRLSGTACGSAQNQNRAHTANASSDERSSSTILDIGKTANRPNAKASYSHRSE